MASYFAFKPSAGQAFTFSPVLDGETCFAAVTWNLAGKRWYLNLWNSNNDFVLCTAIVSSPPWYDISLVGLRYASKLVFRASSGNFEVSP